MKHSKSRQAARWTLLPVVLALTASVILVGTAEGATTQVACGSRLTKNAVMTKDLWCKGNGLILAPGVVLDMAGYTLGGNGTGTALLAIDSGVNTVRNGTIRNWEQSLVFTPDEDSSSDVPPALNIQRLKVVDAPMWIDFATTSVTDSFFRRSPLLIQATVFTATRSTFERSDTSGEMNNIVLKSSRVLAGGFGVADINNVTIVDSFMDGQGVAPRPIVCAGFNVIRNSTLQNYSTYIGAYNDYCPLEVTDSTFKNFSGGAISSAFSQDFDSGQVLISATVRNSTFINSNVAISGGSMRVTGSRFYKNKTGILVDEAQGSSITGSRFSENTENGIFTTDRGLTLGTNKAVYNGKYGIHAPQARNLGGNIAYGNGLANCVGLVCSSTRS